MSQSASSHIFDPMIPQSLLLKILISIFPIAIIIGNFYLFSITKDKIKAFTIQPPFLSFDFTNSYLSNKNSRISHLSDRNPYTTWTKLRHSNRTEDFLLELRQTHHLKENKPEISKWKTLHVVGCKQTLEKLKLGLILRESIDMDKELRMPKDRMLGEKVLNFSKSKHFKIPLEPYYQPEASLEFPQKMFIWTVNGTWITENRNYLNEKKGFCLEDIWLSED
ncbi:hypothetical protein GS511_14720 [Leptospira borgpetersenii]|uniref:Uncharacterized protein n=2 Tax=Leptospira borgpetersenii TaxID=174 RepID=A0A0S2IVI3_LEPBO|nr:hypothetical protein LBBP_03361 [Leptospira borgpetersenii serovar Ballum]EKQ99819.1 hypothetical protein LEP1GSC121_1950 [Leptospira borgpetersenii serovar Castellonis str. 200801910]EMO09150.1 hypothetical protein LEP1GSC137_2706 [Leptospira borgpetersenii str. Noumea 25]QHE28077.1 hypothetical protein GS524_14720 [Leptospira borgpetersenii]QHE31381.1 hypothetical protein GS523_14720 [Leptospira borgpetersenii]